ncbi:shikimate kinase [Chitinophaga sp. LS1]|uniref:shikimate kinase n=1 Tax=Chitinophaga sp. LS1 TaxID=3051176 RepID=UPI002AAAC6FF|nr:shikimate kinase [Chitinophaga sp. LS1]WPV64028.1 shikimate kinase [Chitinophaga sp. LS1]
MKNTIKDSPIVILTGFSTSGKSTLVRKLHSRLGDTFIDIDTDNKICDKAGVKHIYDIYVNHGPDEAIKYIEYTESAVLNDIVNINNKPVVVAAGPFVVLREGWLELIEKRNPYIIYLEVRPEVVYDGLMNRKLEQMRDANAKKSQYFRSWDNNFTVQLTTQGYTDLPRNESIENITQHLESIDSLYRRFRHTIYNVDQLRADPNTEDHFFSHVIKKLDL